MSIITLENRNMSIKAKQLRKASIVPCVIYGGELAESLSVQIDQSTATGLLRQKREGSKMEVKLDGKVIPVQLKEIERNFINNEIIHLGFEALEADVKVNSKAQIILENIDKVTGILEQVLFEIPYSCLPSDMVDTVVVDLEKLRVGTALTVGDLPEFKNENITLQVSPESLVLKINDKKRLD